MLTLGIETSCDETSCSVLKGTNVVLSNVVSSSLFRHQPFGGVVPEIASRHCLEQIDVVFQEALKQAGIKASELDLIAVTQGPGLIGSLLVGVCFAKALSYQLNIPLMAVNHLEAHLVAPWISKAEAPAQLPKEEPSRFIGLLVSGGHTSLSYHEKNKAVLMGETVDDAVGEAYDKVAKILGLGYPGGPIIDKMAKEGNPKAFLFTKPKQKNRFDFSFSGVKTAVLYQVQGHQSLRAQRSNPHSEIASGKKHPRNDDSSLPHSFVCDIAASFQEAAVRWLVDKTLDAVTFKHASDIVVGGGVSANSHLRKTLTEEGERLALRVWFPPLWLTTDNAAMIARRGFEMFQQNRKKNSSKQRSLKLTGNPHLQIAS